MKQHASRFLGKVRRTVGHALAAGVGRKPRWARKLTLELLEDRALLAASFFAPPEPAGSVSVQLVPLANVTAGVQEIVTFGVPFTRGSVTPAQLADVRVLKNGVEVPAFVEQLAAWRSIDDPGIDGQSVRVARIQIPYTFTSLTPESVTVQWGGPARTLNRTTVQDPRLEWHTVTSGTFVAADNVEEPDVLPVLPKDYLSKGMLDAPTIPTNNAVPETRDDPAAMLAATFTGYQEYDSAEKNFFYTIINQNPGITVPYKTDPEPWLYDRSAGMYELYFRSGFATALREAVRAADFYADHLDADGFFTLKPGDPKYAYNESLAYTYWLLGDDKMAAPISRVVNAFNGTATHWTPSLSFFTERNVGDKLLANDMAYEVTGGATYKSNVQTIVGDLVYLQNGANGQLPANRVDGGLYHTGAQHDITEASSGDVLIASSWMSALVVDPMVRVFGVWQDNPQVPDFIVRMGNFEKAASKTDANGQFGGTTRYPDYLMRADGTSDSRSDTDVQHAMDVGGVAAWATYFAELRGTPDPSLRQLANDLYATYDVGVNFWTRPGGTNFNVSPPRRYTWEYKNSPSFSWALTGTDAPAQPGTLSFSAANYTVNENQGTATITVTRTGGSSGGVTVNYATADGTATAGSDYTTVSGTLTFADGETTKTFTVPIIDDTAVENAETVTLTLSTPTGGAALGSPASATLTINSDDATNQPVTVTYQQGVNGYAGTTDADISTQYADFTGGNGTTNITGDQLGVYQLTGTGGYTAEGLIRFDNLGIASNPTTHATVTAATLTLGVDNWEANPVIRGYYLAAPWTTASGTDLGWLHRGTGQDWDTPGALGQGADVVAGKSFVIPGITATGQQTVTINLDPAVVQSWIDNPTSDQGVLLVNETTGAVVRIDSSEHATVAFRPKLGITYTVSSSTTPQPGTLQFSNAAYSVNENAGTATVTVTRTGGTDGPVSVNYATSNGSATAGGDYTAVSGTLTFADGETTKTFTIPILNDSLVETDETVNLVLSSPTGGATLGSPAAAALTIVSDDVPPPPATLQFSGATYGVSESGPTATITVTRTGGSSGAVSVNYATSNGTATAGSDYTAASGTLNLADGETSKTFTVPITNDTAVEGDETVNLTLSNPTGGATLGGQSTATLTIQDDDVAQPGVLQFGAVNYSANENQGTATITVTRTGGSNVPVTVHYATSDGTATAGSDYTATSGTLSFGVGETTKTFTVPIINDTTVENSETVNLTLTSPTGGATLGSPATATLTIVSDDVTGQPVTATFQQGVNGYAGTTDASISTQYAPYTSGNGTTDFTATQLGVYQTTGAGSYTMEGLVRFGNLGIPAGAAVTGATLTLTVDTWTANPTVRGFYLAAPWSGTPGPSSSQLGWLHRGTGSDWAVPGAGGQGTDVVAGNSFVIPGIRAVGQQTITINLDPAVVQAWVNNPSADQGILLVNQSPGAIVRINASENSNVVSRPKLTLTYTSGTATPRPGTLQFGNPTYTVNENGGTATITVTRTNGSDGPVSINYATSNGTATAGSDYTATSGTLTFAAGETSKTFTVPITNDTLFEGNETVNLTLSSPTGGATLGGQATAVLTIQDDDAAPQPGTLQFNAGSYSLAENGGSLTVTVTRTGGTAGAVSVHYATSDGTATAGSDYTAASGTLTFAAGEASKTFTVPVLDDTAAEGSETVTLTLSSPTGGATLGSPATATFTIVDNDAATGVVLPTGFTQTTIATGLNSLTAMAAAPDGRVFVLEQGGAVRVVKNGALLATPAFTVTTVAEQERGLIGITLDPNFTTNHFVYVTYTVGGPSPAPAHNRVSRFTLNGDTAVPGSEVVLLDLPNVTNRIHNGGALKFGADGKLYVAVGNDNVFGNSQDLSNPFGKLLRINPDGSIPTDNPFFNQTTGVNRAIWAYGLRNPYTFDVQPGTGLMYINDVGEASFEEIDQGVAGGNYGWPDSEGYTSNPLERSPVYAYSHGTGPHQGFAIVGAAFYNPVTATFPSQYVGKYFYADFVNGWIEYVDPAAPNPKTPTTFATNLPVRFDGGPVDLEVGADGALYYLDRFGGGVFKIQFTAATQAPTITQQPAGQTVTQGQPATFTVTATGTPPITYQWQKAESGTMAFADIPGATSASFTTGGTTAADNGDLFRVVVSNSAGSTISNAATLTVNPATPPPPPTGSFTNVTAASGVGAIVAQVMQTNPNFWLSGEHLVDLDTDGDLDLVLDSHGGGNAVVALNDGHGVFTRVNPASFPTTEVHQMADINGDGKVDVSATFADGGGQWWINHSTPGNVNFTPTNVTRGTNTSRSQVLLDFNGDGKVDWFRSAPPGLVVDFGDGAGNFAEDSLTFPIVGTDSNDNASFLPADFDGDGKTDLLVLVGGNYDGTPGKTLYWHNNGNLTFTDMTATAGIPANGTIAKGIGDFDQDGDTDFIAITNKSMPPVIYLNDGQGHFAVKPNAITGVAAGSLDYTSWGTAVTTDVDNDGIADIVMDGKYYLKVLRGTGGGNFTYMNNAWGIKDTAAMSVDDGVAFGDIDGDGDLDMIGYDQTFPNRTLTVYRNDLAPQNWLNVRPVGPAGNAGADGAKIRIYAAGTNQLLWYEQVAQYDFQVATSSYGFGRTERHFGLGSRTAVDVVIEFPDGTIRRVNNVAANQTIEIPE
jgi:glucose/arabinose dehydrogenase